MTTVELLQEAVRLAKQAGYEFRFDCPDGHSGGVCHARGKRWIFLDLTASPAEQLEIVADALRAVRMASPPSETPRP